MPLYEYRCRACSHEFEVLVRGEDTPVCPTCQTEDLERLHSSFRASSEAARGMALKAGRRQLAKAEVERAAEQREIIDKHDH